MELKKKTINYNGIDYPAVEYTFENGEGDPNYSDGITLTAADIELWVDMVGETRLNSDEPDEPKDEEGAWLDGGISYYMDSGTCAAYCNGELTDEEMVEEITATL